MKGHPTAFLVHPHCASKPDPVLARQPISWFLGKHVKTAFPAKRPDGSATLEHMWVKVTGDRDGMLCGTVANDPIFAFAPTFGTEVVVARDQLEAVDRPGIPGWKPKFVA